MYILKVKIKDFFVKTPGRWVNCVLFLTVNLFDKVYIKKLEQKTMIFSFTLS